MRMNVEWMEAVELSVQQMKTIGFKDLAKDR